MINTTQILKMAKAAARHDHGYPERRLIHPHREWLIGIMLFTVLLIAGCVAVGLLFMHYQNIEQTVTVEEQRVQTYQAGTVADVLSIYAERTEMFDTMQAQSTLPPESATSVSTSTASTSAASNLPEDQEDFDSPAETNEIPSAQSPATSTNETDVFELRS